MSSNTTISREFATKAALYIAEEKSLSIEDALSYVYNSDTFQMIEDNQLEGKSIEKLMLMFTNEVRYGKAH